MMSDGILKYVHLAGEVWIYLTNHVIRKATAAEIARIVDFDPEFALHFAPQMAIEPPSVRTRFIPLAGLERSN